MTIDHEASPHLDRMLAMTALAFRIIRQTAISHGMIASLMADAFENMDTMTTVGGCADMSMRDKIQLQASGIHHSLTSRVMPRMVEWGTGGNLHEPAWVIESLRSIIDTMADIARTSRSCAGDDT
jgi:hypothetical protein